MRSRGDLSVRGSVVSVISTILCEWFVLIWLFLIPIMKQNMLCYLFVNYRMCTLKCISFSCLNIYTASGVCLMFVSWWFFFPFPEIAEIDICFGTYQNINKHICTNNNLFVLLYAWGMSMAFSINFYQLIWNKIKQILLACIKFPRRLYVVTKPVR